jgi:hypothetical protein
MRPIAFPETSAKTTKTCCITKQKSGDLTYIAAEAGCIAGNISLETANKGSDK